MEQKWHHIKEVNVRRSDPFLCKLNFNVCFFAQTDQQVISYDLPELDKGMEIISAAIDPNQYQIVCGTDQPHTSLFDFENETPIKSYHSLSSDVTTVRFLGNGKPNILLGTYGGTIVNWDSHANRGKLCSQITLN